jgi:hypothetical protein
VCFITIFTLSFPDNASGFVVAFTCKRVVRVKHRVSVSYEGLLLSGLNVTSYKRPSVCPGVVKTLA